MKSTAHFFWKQMTVKIFTTFSLMTPSQFFTELIEEFPMMQEKIKRYDVDESHSNMEAFATYTMNQIMNNNLSELEKCFRFQEQRIEFADDQLINCMTVSYCESMLLGKLGSNMEKIVPLMGPRLRKLYKNYEKYYDGLADGKRLNAAAKLIGDTRLILGYYVISVITSFLVGVFFGFARPNAAAFPVLLGLFFLLIGGIWSLMSLILFVGIKKGSKKVILAHASGLFILGLLIYYWGASGIIAYLD